MSMLEDLRSYVLGDSAVTALIGQRLHPEAVPLESTRPAAMYRLIDTGITRTTRRGESVLHRARVQIGARSERAIEATDVAEAIRKRLAGITAPAGTIQSIIHIAGYGGWDPQLDTHAVDNDFAVWYRPE